MLPRVAPLFFLSGAVALGCETAYFRSLGLLFGASYQVTGTLLGVFMGGLALGSELGARLASRATHPVRLYAAAEAVVGLYAIASTALFADAYEAAGASGTVARVALAFALLALPTIAMGVTLPLLAAAVVPARAELRRGLAVLYSVNLAGGVAGALVVGFVALPSRGLHATTFGLGVVALVVAGLAFVLANADRASTATLLDSDPPGTNAAPTDPLAPWLAALLGVLSFTLQVAWNRVFSLLLGSSSYTFSLVVAVILLATAIGGAASSRDEDDDGTARDDTAFWTKIARRCLGLALSIYLGTLVVYVAPFHLAWAAAHLESMTWVRAGLVAAVVSVPSYQVGALFPALASRFPRGRASADSSGRVAGRAVLVSTLGNVTGAMGAAFVAIPAVGVQSTLVLGAAFALIPALLAASRAGTTALRGMAIGALLAVGLAALLRPGWDAVGLSAGSYRVALYREQRLSVDDRCGPLRHFDENRVLFVRDGPVGTVTVLGHAGGPDCSLYSLRVNGKAEGSVFVKGPLGARVDANDVVLPIGDLPSEVLTGLIPAMAGPPAERAFLVGWGTGISARALLESGAKRVDAAEIEPAVIDAAKLFDPRVQEDSRVHIALDDARMALRRVPPSTFDVIVSHPSNPWVASASALFSREYFSLLRSRLNDGGRVLTWVQLYEIDRLSARSLVATFLEAFPDAHAFRASQTSRDIYLLGIKSKPDAPTTRAQLEATLTARSEGSPSARAELRKAALDGVPALMTTYIGGAKELRAYSGGAPIETDERAAVEFRVADHVLRGTAESADDILRGLDAAPR